MIPSLLEKTSLQLKLSVATILFSLYSLGGWVYETLNNLFAFGGLYLREMLMLPWCPIYGIGGLIVVAALEPLRRRHAERVPLRIQMLVAAIAIYVLTTIVELAGSYICEATMGSVPWDYSTAPFNFEGRIAPMYTACFVVMGLVALYVLYPCVSRWARDHERAACITAGVLAALFVADCGLEALGVWGSLKDALVPYGIYHW